VLGQFREAIDFIEKALDKKERVVVHCGRGISRSATVVIAFLMHKKTMTYVEA